MINTLFFLFLIIFAFGYLYYNLKNYSEFLLKYGDIYKVVKLIDKNIIFVTLSFVNEQPKKMLTILFIIKITFRI